MRLTKYLPILSVSVLAFGLSNAATGQTLLLREQLAIDFSRLAEMLNLTPWQAARARELQADAREAAQHRRERIRTTLDEARAALDAPEPDLWALSRHVEASADGLLAEWRQIKSRRIAFYYDTLTPEQQRIVREALKTTIDRMEWQLQLLHQLDLY